MGPTAAHDIARAFSTALHGVFYAGLVIALISIVTVLFLKEVPLRGKGGQGQGGQGAQGQGQAGQGQAGQGQGQGGQTAGGDQRKPGSQSGGSTLSGQRS